MASDGDDEHEKTITPKSLSMSFDGSFWGMKPLFGDKSTGNSNGDMLDVDNETSFDPDADGASLFDPDAILKSSINTTLKGDCGISIKGTSLDVPASNAESSDLPTLVGDPHRHIPSTGTNIIGDGRSIDPAIQADDRDSTLPPSRGRDSEPADELDKQVAETTTSVLPTHNSKDSVNDIDKVDANEGLFLSSDSESEACPSSESSQVLGDGAAQMPFVKDDATIDPEHSWMYEADASGPDHDLLKVYEKLRRDVSKKMQSGRLTLKDVVELNKAGKRWTTHNRRRNAVDVEEEINSDGLGLQNNQDEPVSNEINRTEQSLPEQPHKRAHSSVGTSDKDADQEKDGSATPHFQSKRRKVRQARSNTASPVQNISDLSAIESLQPRDDSVQPASFEEVLESRLRGVLESQATGPVKKTSKGKTSSKARNTRDLRENDQRKKAAHEASKKLKAPKRGSGAVDRGKSGSNKRREPRKDSKRKRQEGNKKEGEKTQKGKSALELFSDLVNSNPIRERQAQGSDVTELALAATGRKTRILTDLLASLPDDVNKRQMTIDKRDILKASKSFGPNKVRVMNGRWRLVGMKSGLYHHQLLGANFMLDREVGTSAPKGGILADAMGLGKTLQVIAAIVGHPPKTERNHSKTTLLVVPSSVVRQWQKEIELHVMPGTIKKVLHYRRSMNISMPNLLDQDVIITSYFEVMNSFPYPCSKEIGSMNDVERKNWLEEHWVDRGELHQLRFYRVVLDEAHVIRNHRSRTSMACVALETKYRWAVTGTPIQNSLDELYPYFAFLKVPYVRDFTTFKANYCDPKDEASNLRVGHLLNMIMIRRTLKDQIFSRPIVSLPEAHDTIQTLQFTNEERALYEVLEDKFRGDINRFFKANIAAKRYGCIFIMLLRLRQATSHPFLLQPIIRDTFTLEDVRKLEHQIGRIKDKRPFHEQIGVWVKERMEQETGSGSFGQSEFGSNFDMTKYLETLDEQEMLKRCICHICGDIADNPQITDCKHVFCKTCIFNTCHQSATAGEQQTECPACRRVFKNLKDYEDLEARQPQLEDNADADEDGRGRQGKTSKGAWLELSDDLLPSTKLVAVKAKIIEWFRKAPNEKIIVFTHFVLTAKILQRICGLEGWRSVLFTGETSVKSRQVIHDSFTNDPAVKILIAGIKCGGQALNLTAASRVIIVDLWWNHALEMQAFGRVFRIGQVKETYLVRYSISGTVDDRMLKMQDWKTKVVDRAMCDDGQVLPKLSVDELAGLFGYLTKDEEGNTLVAPDLAVEPDIRAQPGDRQDSDRDNGVQTTEDGGQDDDGLGRADDEVEPERMLDIMDVSTIGRGAG